MPYWYSSGLAGLSYNSVSTTVLHCDVFFHILPVSRVVCFCKNVLLCSAYSLSFCMPHAQLNDGAFRAVVTSENTNRKHHPGCQTHRSAWQYSHQTVAEMASSQQKHLLGGMFPSRTATGRGSRFASWYLIYCIEDTGVLCDSIDLSAKNDFSGLAYRVLWEVVFSCWSVINLRCLCRIVLVTSHASDWHKCDS